MFTYDGIEGSHQLIFERVDMINWEEWRVFHFEGDFITHSLRWELYQRTKKGIPLDIPIPVEVEDYTNFVFITEEVSKWFSHGYFDIGNIAQKINAQKTHKMQFKIVWYGYTEIFDSAFISSLTNNV
jgi:hypothetical protein